MASRLASPGALPEPAAPRETHARHVRTPRTTAVASRVAAAHVVPTRAARRWETDGAVPRLRSTTLFPGGGPSVSGCSRVPAGATSLVIARDRRGAEAVRGLCAAAAADAS